MNRSFFIIKNISKKFKNGNGDFYALKNINLEFKNNSFVSVIGKSGSGKSTFLNIIFGIEKPTTGSIIFNNKNITNISDKKFSELHLSDISMIYQHYNLFEDLTAIENVIIPLLLRGDSKEKSVQQGCALFKQFELEKLINQKVKNLSGGEKQRVAIMRALITSPKIILCDEPTGALDKKNSILIMDLLKKISSTKLVIMVSHNNDLVKKYSDRIINFKDGEIESDKLVKTIDETEREEIKKIKYSSKWIGSFVKLNLSRNKRKVALSLIAMIVGFTSVFLSFGFSNGTKTSQKKALETNLASTYSTVSETTYIKIENSPLMFEKNIRPSLKLIDEKIVNFDTVVCCDNLSYFFSNYPIGKYHNEPVDGFEMIPILNLSEKNYRQSLLLYGNLPENSLFEVVVNKEFADLINVQYDNVIDQEFNISYSCSISIPTNDENNPFIKDEFSYNLNLKIKGIVNEFSFLNTPKIYYSYEDAKDFLSSSYCENISYFYGKRTSYFNLIENSKNDSVVSSYSSILFLTSLTEKEQFFELIDELSNNKNNLKISSTAFDIEKSYISFIDSFTSALYVFVIIAFLGINFIIGMISLSNFIQYKKETAILTCLGARNRSIVLIYLIENYLVAITSFVFSVLCSMIVQKILNPIIYNRFSLSDLFLIPWSRFLNVKFGLPIIVLLISLLCISLFTLVPLFIYRRISLTNELRDE